MPRLVIDEQQFRDLVAGRPVTHQDGRFRVEIVLWHGIGWVKLVRAVLDAIAPRSPEPLPPLPPDPPEAREFLPPVRKKKYIR